MEAPRRTPKALFTQPDDNHPMFFFLEPKSMSQELCISFEVAITRRGGCVLKPGMEVPVRGVIILVDPREEQGKKYIRGDRPEKASRVVSYTYLRACIFKDTLLPTTIFKGVMPVFEVGPRALKIFLEPRLVKSLTPAQLDELKLKISMYGGHSGVGIDKAHVILANKEDVPSLRRRHRESHLEVEALEWIQQSIDAQIYEFGRQFEGGASEPSDDIQSSTPVKSKSKSPRYEYKDLQLRDSENDPLNSPHRLAIRKRPKQTSEFTEADENHFVQYMAELYPTKGKDNERTRMEAYEHLVSHPALYPWSTRGGSGTWQTHYTRHHDMFDRRIDEYLDLHPAIIRTKREAARIRTKVFTQGKKTNRRTNKRRLSGETEEEDEAVGAEEEEEEDEGNGGIPGSPAEKKSARQSASTSAPVSPIKVTKKRARTEIVDEEGDDREEDINPSPVKKARKAPAKRSARQQRTNARVKPVSIIVDNDDDVGKIQTRRRKRQTSQKVARSIKTRGGGPDAGHHNGSEQKDQEGEVDATPPTDDHALHDRVSDGEVEVEQELDRPLSSKSVTVNEEEVERLESNPEKDDWSPARLGQQSDPSVEDTGGKDKYSRAVNPGKRGKKVAVAQGDTAGHAKRKPTGKQPTDNRATSVSSMQTPTRRGTKPARNEKSPSTTRDENIKSILRSDGVDDPDVDLDDAHSTVEGPSKVLNKIDTQPKPRRKFSSTPPNPNPTLDIPTQLSPILEERCLSVPRIETLEAVPEPPTTKESLVKGNATVGWRVTTRQATTARLKGLRRNLAPNPFVDTDGVDGEVSTDSDGNGEEEEGGSRG
ncbi:hypothetical protein FRB97_004454 [Tulasnella sp. 331]|nr:hypothetical protein FRB97_004454 [Tulasnella sp. 331]